MYVPIIHKQLKHQQQTASRSGEPSVIAYKGNLALSNEQLRTQDNSFADQRALMYYLLHRALQSAKLFAAGA